MSPKIVKGDENEEGVKFEDGNESDGSIKDE